MVHIPTFKQCISVAFALVLDVFIYIQWETPWIFRLHSQHSNGLFCQKHAPYLKKKKVQHIYYLSFAVSCRKTSLLTARDILYYSEGNHKSSQTSTWLHVTVTFLTCKASNNVNFIRPTAKFCVKEELYYVCHKAQQTSFLMKY